MSEEKTFDLTIRLLGDYQMDVEFDGEKMAHLLVDEPEPLGNDDGPNAARVLGAAIGNCLSASLLFCLRKARVNVENLRTEIQGRIVRNERGRYRIESIQARILTTVPEEERARMTKCLEVFEDFCIVSASVREGIRIDVEVEVV